MFPFLEEEIEAIESTVVWKQGGTGSDEVPAPRPGLDSNYDQANERVESMKEKLELYLKAI